MSNIISVDFRKAAPEAARHATRNGEIDRFPTREAFDAFRRQEIAANPYSELIGLRLLAHRNAAFALVPKLQKLAETQPERPRTILDLLALVLTA